MRFMCYLNWTEQGARAMKDAPKRYEASRAIVEKLGGRIVSAYVTTGQYDVALTLDMPNGDAMTQFVVSLSARGQRAHNDRPGMDAGGIRKTRCRGTLNLGTACTYRARHAGKFTKLFA